MKLTRLDFIKKTGYLLGAVLVAPEVIKEALAKEPINPRDYGILSKKEALSNINYAPPTVCNECGREITGKIYHKYADLESRWVTEDADLSNFALTLVSICGDCAYESHRDTKDFL